MARWRRGTGRVGEERSTQQFTEVLTLCSGCRREIVVKASYEERNNKFTCEECAGK